ENGAPRRESAWPDGTDLEAATPGYPDTPDTSVASPGAKASIQTPSLSLPEWLRQLLTMPLPQVSTAVDPLTGRRIVPYEPLIGPVRSYLTTDQNARSTADAHSYFPGINALLGLEPVAAPNSEPRPFLNRPPRLPDINALLDAATLQST